VVRWTLRWKTQVIAGALALVVLTIPLFLDGRSEFMPPLDEGSPLYMRPPCPALDCGSAKALQATDGILRAFPRWITFSARRAARHGDRPRPAFDA